MTLFRKLILIIPIFLFVWFNSVSAITKDVLLVNLSFDSTKSEDQAFIISDIEQRVLDESNFVVSSEGKYKLSLIDSDSEHSNNGFDIPPDTELELIGANEGYGEGQVTSTQNLLIILPLTENVNISLSRLLISESSTKKNLLSKNLADIPSQVSAAKNYSLISQDNSEFPPFEEESAGPTSHFNSVFWFIIIAVSLAVIVVIYLFIRRTKTPKIPPPSPY